MTKTWIATVGAVVALLAGGAIGWAIGANTGGNHMGDGSMAMMDGVSETHHGMMAMNEKAFLQMMVAHHQMALDMAEAELEMGKDPKVRALARRIEGAQKREIRQMRAMYEKRYGAEVPPLDEGDASMMAMMGMAGMTAQAVSGASNPDQAFLRMMIPHHAGAILMADMVLNDGPDDDVEALANAIIDEQSAEIAEMQEMRAAN